MSKVFTSVFSQLLQPYILVVVEVQTKFHICTFCSVSAVCMRKQKSCVCVCVCILGNMSTKLVTSCRPRFHSLQRNRDFSLLYYILQSLGAHSASYSPNPGHFCRMHMNISSVTSYGFGFDFSYRSWSFSLFQHILYNLAMHSTSCSINPGSFSNGAREHQVSDMLWFWMRFLTKQMGFPPSLLCHVWPCGHLNWPSFYTRSFFLLRVKSVQRETYNLLAVRVYVQ